MASLCSLVLPESQMFVVQVPASVGVTASKGDVDLDELSQAANQAMNLARQGGSNQVASIDRAPIHLTTDQAPI